MIIEEFEETCSCGASFRATVSREYQGDGPPAAEALALWRERHEVACAAMREDES